MTIFPLKSSLHLMEKVVLRVILNWRVKKGAKYIKWIYLEL